MAVGIVKICGQAGTEFEYVEKLKELFCTNYRKIFQNKQNFSTGILKDMGEVWVG